MARTVREELKARKQAYVQEEILNSAERLFAERGIRAVSIDDIANNLGYTKSVVYYYFKNKNQLLWEIFQRIHVAWDGEMEELYNRTDLAPADKLAAMARLYGINVLQNRAWTTIYFRDEGELTKEQQKLLYEWKQHFDSILKNVYLEGVEKGVFKSMPPYVVVGGIIGACNFLRVWFRDTGKMTIEEVSEANVALLLGGLLIGRSRKTPKAGA